MNKADCIFELKQIRGVYAGMRKEYRSCVEALGMAINALEQTAWIPCSERLPKINQSVLLSTNGSVVFIGHRTKPELIWQVTEEDGKKHWVYDPEAYTDDIESLPKGEDCAFDSESQYEDSVLSVTSANYNPRFGGVVAWMPLPEPYGGDGE